MNPDLRNPADRPFYFPPLGTAQPCQNPAAIRTVYPRPSLYPWRGYPLEEQNHHLLEIQLPALTTTPRYRSHRPPEFPEGDAASAVPTAVQTHTLVNPARDLRGHHKVLGSN